MKFNYLILASLISQPIFASELSSADTEKVRNLDNSETKQTALMPARDNQLLIEVQGEQYRSVVQIDLSDPNLILVIDTDAVDVPIYQTDGSDEANEVDQELTESLSHEARALALRIEAKEAAANGEYDKALELLEQSEQLAENPAQIFAMKGSVLYKLKDMEGAIQAWKQAHKLDPSMTEVAEMLKWLEK